MSELKKTRDVSTYQKLLPPKSLQGEEDAEVTWDLILKRYPNAAPLLCEMETVIERAEGLLQQLRSPYTHALERSSSFQIADSEDEFAGLGNVEESTEVSMVSEQNSSLISAESITSEVVSVAKISTDCNQKDQSTSEQTLQSVNAEPFEVFEGKSPVDSGEKVWTPELSSSSFSESNSKSQRQELELKPNINESQKSIEERELGKSLSLEAWGKVVGENVTNLKHRGPLDLKGTSQGTASANEDSVSEHARRLTELKTGPMQQITKLNLLGKKEELMQRFAGTIATATKVVDTTQLNERTDKLEEVITHVKPVEVSINDTLRNTRDSEGINERGEQTANPSLKNSENSEQLNEVSKTSDESIKKEGAKPHDEFQGNGDESIVKSGLGPRSPVEILDEYSKICNVPVEYKNSNPTVGYNKKIIVKCCFGGFAFEACAQSRKIAKTAAAAKLLRCLAGRQIDGESTSTLKPFTRKQIEEIISLGTGGEHETAIRKLYKICMELNAPEPVYYTVQQSSGVLGNRYMVKCEALGYTTSGFGIRVHVAKRVAADELLHTYHKDWNSTK